MKYTANMQGNTIWRRKHRKTSVSSERTKKTSKIFFIIWKKLWGFPACQNGGETPSCRISQEWVGTENLQSRGGRDDFPYIPNGEETIHSRSWLSDLPTRQMFTKVRRCCFKWRFQIGKECQGADISMLAQPKETYLKHQILVYLRAYSCYEQHLRVSSPVYFFTLR